MNAVEYLGTIITAEGVKPDPAKIAAISNMLDPVDKSAVKCLLGMANFLANHIPNVSSITVPLRDLVKNDIHFQWGPEQDKALNQIESFCLILLFYSILILKLKVLFKQMLVNVGLSCPVTKRMTHCVCVTKFKYH